VPTEPVLPPTIKINDSLLALALLNSKDVHSVINHKTIRPSLIELNDHLNPSIDKEYYFYVARTWYARKNGQPIITNAITQFKDTLTAKVAITQSPQHFIELTPSKPLGDSMTLYYQAPDKNKVASILYRFTVQNYVAKVQLFTTVNDTAASDAVIQEQLLPMATALAQQQADHITTLLAGTFPVPALSATQKLLPPTLNNTRYIGMVPFSAAEWLAVTNALKKKTIVGFSDGALNRFQLNSRPQEVVEVAVMQFNSPTTAKQFLAELVKDPATSLELPATFGEYSHAIQEDNFGLVELRAVKGQYVIDISIFAPFGDINMAAASTDIITISDEVLTNFAIN
jgi:hypothetical protein